MFYAIWMVEIKLELRRGDPILDNQILNLDVENLLIRDPMNEVLSVV